MKINAQQRNYFRETAVCVNDGMEIPHASCGLEGQHDPPQPGIRIG